MKKTLRLILTFLLIALIVFLFWAITTNNFFVSVGIGIPDGIIIGALFTVFDYFYFKNKTINNKFWIRLIVFLALFLIVTSIHFLIEQGEIIKPLKNIFSS